MKKASKTSNNNSMAAYVGKKLSEISSRKTQKQVAAEIGYPHPNMISMIKTGEARVPLSKVPALARAIEGDAAYMFRLALEALADEDLSAAVQEIFGNIVSKNEAEVIEFLRQTSSDPDVRLTPELRRVLLAAFGPQSAGAVPIVVSAAQRAPEAIAEALAPAVLQDLNFKVSGAFHRRFKMAAADAGISMKELLERAFETLVEKEGH